MASLSFSDFAYRQVSQLPRDATLLRAVWRHLERAANDPDNYTEFPPPYPHRQDRRLCAFKAHDAGGQEWAFSVLLADVEGGLQVMVFTFNSAADYAEFEPDPPEFDPESDPESE